MSVPCPCCGQPMSETGPQAVIATIPLGWAERKIVNHLAGRFGQYYGYRETEDFYFANRSDGGPESGFNLIAVLVHRVNKKLIKYGLRIEGHTGYGRRLVWTRSASRVAA